MNESVIVKCPSCATKNRIPISKAHNKRPICGKCKTPLDMRDLSRPIEVTDHTFQQEVLAHEGAVLVDCWAPWCGPCRIIGPILDELALSFSGKAKIVKLNVDENPLTASQFQIQSIPTLLFFKAGKLVDKLVGAVPKEEIERRLVALI